MAPLEKSHSGFSRENKAENHVERELNSNSGWQMSSVLYTVITFYFVIVILELVMQGTVECGRKLSMEIRLSKWEKK